MPGQGDNKKLIDRELSNKEREYIVMRFFRQLHEDERFIVIQRPIKKLLGILLDNKLYALLEQVSVKEFITVCDDISLVRTADLQYLIDKLATKPEVDEKIVDLVEGVIINASKEIEF